MVETRCFKNVVIFIQTYIHIMILKKSRKHNLTSGSIQKKRYTGALIMI